MIKPTGHKERNTIKSEVSRSYSDDGTAARTRPFSFDEIMLRRKMKKETGNVDDQRVETDVVLGKGDEDMSGRVESVRHGDDVRDSERDGCRETLKISSRSEEDRYRSREDEIVDSEREKRVSRDPVKLSSRTKEDKPQLREDKIEDSEHEKRVSRDSVKLSSRIKEDKPSLREDKIVESEHEQLTSREPVKVSSRTKEDKPKVREDKIVESEYERRASRKVGKISSRVKEDQSKMREDKIVESEYELGAFREHVKASSRLKEDQFKVREDKIVESEYGQRTSRDPMKVTSRTKEDRSNLREDRVRETNRSNLREDRTRESKYEQYSFRDGYRTKEDKSKVQEEKIGEREYEKHTSKDLAKVSSRAKENKSKVREDKTVESEYNKHAFRDPVKVNSRTKEDKSMESEYGRYASRDLAKVASRTQEEKSKVREDKIVESEYKQHASRDPAKVSSQAKEDKSKGREEKMVEIEFKVRSNTQIRSEIVSNNVKDKRSERGHEKRKNQDRVNDEFDREHVKRHAKEPEVKDSDRENSEHVSKRKTQNGYDERGRDQDAGKKHESRKWHDSSTSENKQKGLTSESFREDLNMRSKRSRSREHERDRSKRSKSRSPRGHKQRLYDAREHEDVSSHSSKDRKKISNNGSSNKSKRHDASSSRLGGYSPRKRRSEAAVKTPSPTSRSPEKKSTVWDSPPAKMESNVLLSKKIELSNRHEVSSTVLLTPSIPKPTFGVLSSIPLMMNASVDSVQLTQATRPKRRIYVENLPSSASEEAVMKWLSGYLRPYGVNQAQGTGPCISCIMNKDKGQALVEFLTPEDASTALHLDGKSFSGNILRIRRPKDYVETTTGVLEKPAAGAVSSVRNIVEDSPNKIFIGGISNVITSEMLKEIASAFGPLKAYHFEEHVDLDSPCAFVEYADQSVTVKACVGLNGMKLGGQVLTVTQALPEASSVENQGGQPFYGTPVHVRQLLKNPTQVLKLSNVLDPHSLSSLSELDLEEILEDLRLECARFGIVKSINIIKQPKMLISPETITVDEEANSMIDEVTEPSGQHEKVEEPAAVNLSLDKQDDSAPQGGDDEPEKVNGDAEANGIDGNKHEDKMVEEETYDTKMVDSVIENQNLENPNQTSSVIDHLKLNDFKPTDNIQAEIKSPKAESCGIDDSSDINEAFEAGCVLVEYKRTEASSMAAHCLHGRVFDGRMVNVEYVAYDVYCTRFHK
uniref:uncharacterized protein LOC122581313 n=1 Tax=Erigeron canadensis TaxID=72917 RepID=UPI001CB9ADCB|nr:uncharacterized protein LOC122581313 [Erigeron canadensis]